MPGNPGPEHLWHWCLECRENVVRNRDGCEITSQAQRPVAARRPSRFDCPRNELVPKLRPTTGETGDVAQCSPSALSHAVRPREVKAGVKQEH